MSGAFRMGPILSTTMWISAAARLVILRLESRRQPVAGILRSASTASTGTLVGTCAVPGTGGWQTWVTRTCSVSGVTGVHNVYLKFTGGSGYLFNVNWWKFNFSTLPAVPAAPGGLVATAGVESAALSWTAASNATSYNVKRATTSGGPYTTIANVVGDELHRRQNNRRRNRDRRHNLLLRVSALNVGGESANSARSV